MGAESDRVGRLGVHGVALLVVGALGWKFREQHESDWGIDAIIEIAEDDRPIGRLIALQVKSGESRLSQMNRNGQWTMYGEKHHLSRWLEYQIPVLVVLYDPASQAAYWQHVDAHTAEWTPAGFKIDVPAAQRLDSSARGALRAVAERWVPHRATTRSRAVQAIGACQAAGVPVPATVQLWDLLVDGQRRPATLKSTVRTYRLPLAGDAPAVTLAAQGHDRVVPLSARDLRGLWSVPTDTTVYICENLPVINAAAARLGDRSRPLVCMGGFPSPVVEYLLLGLGFSGARLKLHADHDAVGRLITDSLFSRSVKYELWCPRGIQHSAGTEEECLDRILAELGTAP
jgi:hypothetical protein